MRDRNRILVIGGTGQVGRDMVRHLLARNAKVRVLTRDVQRASSLFESMDIPADHLQDLEFTQGDLDEHGILDLLMEDADRAFLLSTPDERLVEQHGAFIQAARNAELKCLVRLSAVGADPASPARFMRWHGQADQILAKSGLPHAILRPHYFMQNLLGFASSVSAHHDFHAPMGEGRIGLVDTRDVAEAAAALVALGQGCDEPFVLTGPESLSFREVAAEMSEAFDLPVAYIAVSPEEARQEFLAMGMPAWTAQALLELYHLFHLGQGDFTSHDLEHLIGRRPRSVRAFLREHVRAFTGSRVRVR